AILPENPRQGVHPLDRVRAFHLALPDGKPEGGPLAPPAASPRAGLTFLVEAMRIASTKENKRF
ncbi:MAG: hypothetical protein LBB05_03015, partial [Puniceicoccales bacterium]|nr:hypothetical protein [Puniceicoccales bacterium]